MGSDKQYSVVEIPALEFPVSFHVPARRFRLLVAADTADLSVETISNFTEEAFRRGMVYFCAWGQGCERFHDIVDECRLGIYLDTGHSFPVMTTWHNDEALEDALDFFAYCAKPDDSLLEDSDFRLVISVGSQDWATKAREFLEAAPFFG